MRKRMSRTGACAADACPRKIHARGLCEPHYRKALRDERKKPCACGCGELTNHTYKHGHHTRLFTSAEQSRRASFQTGDSQRDRGDCTRTYRKVRGRHEHRIVAAQKIGRPLRRGEIVHHINGNIRDNRPENLQVMSQGQHIEEHRAEMMAARKEKHGY